MSAENQEEQIEQLRDLYRSNLAAKKKFMQALDDLVVTTMERNDAELDADDEVKTQARKRAPKKKKREEQEEAPPSPPKKQATKEWKCEGNTLRGTQCPGGTERHEVQKTKKCCVACHNEMAKDKRQQKKQEEKKNKE